ncbi:NlpC/P60 family protein [Corynebacterium rhinophilum]|uniref:NlpC/P60 family protein n=1 Tax=Corynebacterium rhinophilum TaxID=3050197 RepID=UPI00254E008A|nr:MULTISPECIES: NlpC/P60 family protein [unclassified Corynebacterium]MDK8467035.1 NlpC/P60 family protein [Corynebacterium sp. MSK130]MDK8687782.1 NlpC/P60 family protein [Corynebacterium sp. MSK122]
MATIRLPRIRHVRATIAAVIGVAALSPLTSIAPAGADELLDPTQAGAVEEVPSTDADDSIARAVSNVDAQQRVDQLRQLLDQAEEQAAAATERIAQLSADPAVADDAAELDQAYAEKRAAESAMVEHRRNLAQREAQMNATRNFAEASFAHQQQAVEVTQQGDLPKVQNQDKNLDFRVGADALSGDTVKPQGLNKDKAQNFTDEIVPDETALPEVTHDDAVVEGQADAATPKAEFGTALNQGATPSFNTVDYGTGSSASDVMDIAGDLAAAVDQDDMRALMDGSADLLGIGSPNTAPSASTDPSATGQGPGAPSNPAPGNSSQIEAVIARAESVIGTPYVWGGGDNNGPTGGLRDGGIADSFGDYGRSGFDCSGLTKYAFAAAGLDLPHYSGAQYQMGNKVSRDNLQRGDLIFYGAGGSQHVAIYLGNDQMIEAPQSGQNVQVSPVRWAGATPEVVRLL